MKYFIPKQQQIEESGPSAQKQKKYLGVLLCIIAGIKIVPMRVEFFGTRTCM